MTSTATSEDQGHLEKLARRGTASVAGAGFSALSGVLLVVIVTNGFSQDTAGTLFAATAAFLIIESIALLGTDTGLVKWLPTQLADGRTDDVRRTLVIAAVPVLALSLGAGVLLFAAAPSLAPHMVGNGNASTMSTMLKVLAVILPAAALYDLTVAASRGLGSMRPTVLIDNLGRLGVQALAVLAVFLAGGGPFLLALAWCLPYVGGLVAAGWWMHVRIRDAPSGSEPATPWIPLTREFWSYTSPRAIARVTQTALKRSDVVLVAALASPAEAALYAAATRFIVLGQLFVQSVQQALAPHLSSLFARDEKHHATSVFQTATLWSVIASWPFFLILAGFSPLLMGVFGHGYSVASDVVLILSLTMLLATACGPIDSVLLMAGRSWLSLGNSSVALAVNVGMNIVLIPMLGIRGAAISWAVAIVVRNVLPLLQVHQQLDMWPVTRPAVLVSLLAVACFGLVDVLALSLDLPTFVEVAALGLSVLVYLYVLRSWHHILGLGAFRSALRRRSGSPRPAAPLGSGPASSAP